MVNIIGRETARSLSGIALSILAALMMLCTPHTARAELRLVATIAPLHSLAASLLKGIAEPKLLIRSAQSPHDYRMRPSEIRLLADADIIIGVDRSFETGLKRQILRVRDRVKILWFLDMPTVRRYRFRGTGIWSRRPEMAPSADKGGAGTEPAGRSRAAPHRHDLDDPHLWLDPGNAIAFIRELSKLMIERDKAHTEMIRANEKRLEARLRALDEELKARLKPVADKPFLVYHDAFQYFEKRYGLQAMGAVTADAHIQPGARHLVSLRNIFKSGRVTCLFTEPQFRPRLAARLISGTGGRLGTLDPLGAAIQPGPDQYFTLMRNLASGLVDCLSLAR